ncbi:MAG: hypothetical protein R3E52_07045 [Burkholderiaceae bacterium]
MADEHAGVGRADGVADHDGGARGFFEQHADLGGVALGACAVGADEVVDDLGAVRAQATVTALPCTSPTMVAAGQAAAAMAVPPAPPVTDAVRPLVSQPFTSSFTPLPSVPMKLPRRRMSFTLPGWPRRR